MIIRPKQKTAAESQSEESTPLSSRLLSIAAILFFGGILIHECGHILAYSYLGIKWTLAFGPELISVMPVLDNPTSFDAYYGNTVGISLAGGLLAFFVLMPVVSLDIRLCFMPYLHLSYGLTEPFYHILNGLGLFTSSLGALMTVIILSLTVSLSVSTICVWRMAR